MRLEDEFSLPLSPASVWDAILADIERVVSCIPGAELTEVLSPTRWAGRFSAKMGPISLRFSGNVEVEELDLAERRLVLGADGAEIRGRGTAHVVVTLVAESDGGEGSTVKMASDVTLTGRVAQLSRGMLPKVARNLTASFARCLSERLKEGAS